MAKILIIEDDPYISRTYHRMFSLENYQVELAEDGEEGLLKAKSFQPTLILLDLKIPKKDGFAVLDALKADASTKAIPVVVLTNMSSDDDEKNVLAKGAIKYILKSDYEPMQVADMVKQILTGMTVPQ